MNIAKTTGDILSVIRSITIAKDVLSLLEKKCAILIEQTTVLLSENTQLKIENGQLRQQLKYSQPHADKIVSDKIKILRFLAERSSDTCSPESISGSLGIEIIRIHALRFFAVFGGAILG